MTTKTERLAALYKEAYNCIDEMDPEVVQLLEEGEWTQDHKTQYSENIVQFEGEFFCIAESRSGSYHTDWFYDDAFITPVNRVEETKVVVTWPGRDVGVCVAARN